MRRIPLAVTFAALLLGGFVHADQDSAQLLSTNSDARPRSACREDDRGRRSASSGSPGIDGGGLSGVLRRMDCFYQDFYQFPPDIPATFSYGFDSYKVTYCTVDAVLPGERRARPSPATGMVSVPRKRGPLSTVDVAARHVGLVLRRGLESSYLRPVQPGWRKLRRPTVERRVRRQRLHLRRAGLPRARRFDRSAPPLLSRGNRGIGSDRSAGRRAPDARTPRRQQNGRLFTFGFSQGDMPRSRCIASCSAPMST